MLADLSECDRIAEKARDGRGLAVIWEIPTDWDKNHNFLSVTLGRTMSAHAGMHLTICLLACSCVSFCALSPARAGLTWAHT